nr:MAG TPA: hypothetical protein [Bacteriophage sp.]
MMFRERGNDVNESTHVHDIKSSKFKSLKIFPLLGLYTSQQKFNK